MTKSTTRRWLVIALGLAPSLSLSPPARSQSPPAPVLPRSTNPTCLPVKRSDWAANSMAVYRANNPADLKSAQPKLVFLGDSITQLWHSDTVNGWEGGTLVWNKYYASLPAVNLGIAGDKTENVLWRITAGGDLEGINPRVLVLLIGVNNLLFYGGANSPGQTAEGIMFIVNHLKQKLPETKILLLAIFPCGQKAEDPMRERIRRTNRLIAAAADLQQVFYLDLGDRFIEPDGSITKEKFRDFLHLSEKGYEIWAEAMQPYLEDLLNHSGQGDLWKDQGPKRGTSLPAANRSPAPLPTTGELTPPRPATDETAFGAKIARTMTALATSTPTQHNPVRLLFYGQSITAQSWSQAIGNRLRQEYPNADFSFENRAIGGFTAERLVKTAVHDLYPAYPDLVIFHVYGGDGGMNGGVGGELETIIANIRRFTTAEIVLTTHHVSHVGNAAAQADHEKTSQLIRDLAAEYDCELVEVREEWKQYLSDNHLQPQNLLADVVHLNDQGCKLMEALVWRHLRYQQRLANPHADWIKTVPVQPGPDGSIKVNFTGNRVDLVAATTDKPLGTARILIDRQPPSANPKAYAITRPSQASGVWWPALYTVGFHGLPLVEDWTLKLTDVSEDAKQFKFDVTGSRTGPDGSGSSTGKFVSTSGRVVVDPRDFTIDAAQAYTKKKCPADFAIKWSVVPMFQDTYRPRSVRTTVAQLIENGPHTLEIVPNNDGAVPVKAIQVFQPWLP